MRVFYDPIDIKANRMVGYEVWRKSNKTYRFICLWFFAIGIEV